MPVTLGARPLAGFDRPIDLLMDCHRRIENFLDVLIRVAERAAAGPIDAEHHNALETALQYFRAAAPRHTEDEERSLFPLLRQHDDPRVRDVVAQVDQLEAEHKQADALHAQTNVMADRLLAEGRLDDDDAQRLVDMLRSLRELYRRHIAAEDQLVFPIARRALSEHQLDQVGREMSQRRSDDPGRPESRCGQRRRRQIANARDASARLGKDVHGCTE